MFLNNIFDVALSYSSFSSYRSGFSSGLIVLPPSAVLTKESSCGNLTSLQISLSHPQLGNIILNVWLCKCFIANAFSETRLLVVVKILYDHFSSQDK